MITAERGDGKIVELSPGVALTGWDFYSVTITREPNVLFDPFLTPSKVERERFEQWFQHLMSCRLALRPIKKKK